MTTDKTNASPIVCAAKLDLRHVNMFLARQSLERLCKARGFLGAALDKTSYTLTVYVELEAYRDITNVDMPRDVPHSTVLFDTSQKKEG